MEKIKSYMMSIGGFIAVAGILSIILSFIGYNLRILMWIDMWGPTMGWIIRIGLVVLGGILFIIGKLSSRQA
ncbi:MAG: hypothetical protein JXA20_02940 [Spirochaetes bacterium]|nr:hypothetical protein [Spirochaetota bacterium]